jgi:hypothetical protein
MNSLHNDLVWKGDKLTKAGKLKLPWGFFPDKLRAHGPFVVVSSYRVRAIMPSRPFVVRHRTVLVSRGKKLFFYSALRLQVRRGVLGQE